MSNDHTYTFVTREEDVDLPRVIREAPANTPFILVEERTRNGRSKGSILFVGKDILSEVVIQDKPLAGKKVKSTWGKNAKSGYRYMAFPGSFPGYIKQEIEHIRRELNPKDTVTKITYL